MITYAMMAALAYACADPGSNVHTQYFLRVADVQSPLELSGFRLGMTPLEVVAAAKAKGLPFRAHQEPLPQGGVYPAWVSVDGPTRVRVTFSALTRTVDAIDAVSIAPIMPGAGDDPLFQAATAKWGKWTGSDGFRGAGDVPAQVWWGDRAGPHAEYSNSKWDQGSPSSVRIVDPAALKASEDSLKAPAAPLPKL